MNFYLTDSSIIQFFFASRETLFYGSFIVLSNSSRFLCPNLCGRSYKYKRGVYTHVKFECGVEPSFLCSLCPKKFARKFQLESHLVLKHKVVKIRCNFTH